MNAGSAVRHLDTDIEHGLPLVTVIVPVYNGLLESLVAVRPSRGPLQW